MRMDIPRSSLKAAPWHFGSALFSLERSLFVIAVGAILAGSLVKLAFLNYQSLGFDEIITYLFSDRGLSARQLWDRFWAYDVHPPLYYAVTHYWTMLFGYTDEVVLRSLSAVFAVAASLLALVAYRRFFRAPGLLLFVTLVSCNFGLIFYAQEARQYSLVFLLSLLLLTGLLTVWTHLRDSRCLPTAPLWWCCIVGVLLSNTHPFGVIYVVACFLTMMILIRAYAVATTRAFWAVAALTAAAAAPWPLWALFNFATIRAHNYVDWLSIYMNPLYLIKTTSWLMFSNHYSLLLVLLAVMACGYVGQRRGAVAFPGIIWVALIPSAMVAVVAIASSSLVMPLLSHRNWIVLFPSVYFALAALLEANLSRRVMLATTALLGPAMLIPSLLTYYEPHKTQWRESARYIADERGCSEGVIPFFPPMLAYGGTLLHSVHLPDSLELRAVGPRVPPGEIEAKWGLADLSAALDEAAVQADNDCGVLLWVVPSNWLGKGPEEWAVPEGIEIKQFFEAAVLVRQ